MRIDGLAQRIECLALSGIAITLYFRDKEIVVHEFSSEGVAGEIFEDICLRMYEFGFLRWEYFLFEPRTIFGHEVKWTEEDGYHVAITFESGNVYCVHGENADECAKHNAELAEKIKDIKEFFGDDDTPPTIQ